MQMMMRAVATGLFLATLSVARAQDGMLTVTDGRTTVEFDKDKLAAMEQDVIETSTVWTEGTGTFAGPSFQAVLQEAGLAGETVLAEALDGYSVEIPRGRLTGDGAILATTMNGEPLPEDKAPYWIIFPYDQSPEINDTDHQDWSVWAVSKLTVQ